MDTKELELQIASCLQDFYKRRLQVMEKLKLKTFLRRKNPYLIRALAFERASDIVEYLLTAHVAASDETIFGDAFFEPIAKLASHAVVSPTTGVDFAIETKDRYLAVALKSGPYIFNASQKKRQSDEFNELRSRLLKLHKQFDAILGHAYGRVRSEPNRSRLYRDLSGQAFWAEITGDPDFYLKLIRLMKDKPREEKAEYLKAWDKAMNRFTGEFTADFCFKDGSVAWEKLVKFVSAEKT